MSLWNSMKNWIDNPAKTTQQTPVREQPAGEGAPEVTTNAITVSNMFYDICIEDFNINLKTAEIYEQDFLNWYDGPVDREKVKECVIEFSKQYRKLRNLISV